MPWFNRTVRPLRADRFDNLFRPHILSADLIEGFLRHPIQYLRLLVAELG